MIKLISLFVIALVIIQNGLALDYWTNCSSDPQYSTNSPYHTNLEDLLHTFPYQALASGFYNASRGQAPNQAYGLYLCRADLNSSACSECVYLAHVRILQDCSTPSAILWSNRCMLRFSNTPFFQTMSISPIDRVPGSQNLTPNQIQVLNKAMVSLVNQVANSSGKFGTNVTGSDQRIYALGQCTPNLKAGECEECLKTAIPQLPQTVQGRVFQPSCYIIFEFNNKWYGDSVNVSFLLSTINNPTLSGQGQRLPIGGSSICGSSIMGVISSALLSLILLI